MRILLASHFFAPHVGGVEVMSEALASGWSERFGDDVTVVTHTSEPADREMPFHVLRAPSRRQLWEAVRDADVVFHNNPCIKFYWPQVALRRPWVVTMRAWLIEPQSPPGFIGERIKDPLKRGIIHRADRLVANSQAMADHIGHVDRIIPNSYRDDVFGTEQHAPRDRRRWAFVGRLFDHKGVDLIIEALSALRAEGHDLALEVVGDGPDRPRLERLVREADCAEVVTFHGMCTGPQTAEVLHRAGIGIVPSRMPETFGTVALEMAASGAVPVVSDHGGLPDAAGPTGVPFAPSDAQSLTAALQRLLTDDVFYSEKQKTLVAHARANTMDRMVDAYHDEVELALGKRT